jgi:NADPH-dependent ferric siderophore reductase
VLTVAPDGSGAAVLDALARLAPIGEGTFVWAAGEAASLVPVRRHLRRTLGLSAAQAQVSGYWRRGVEAFDHHAPIDPFDPDE